MSERQVESNLVKRVKKRGGIAYKFTSPAHRGTPDRICLFPVKPMHQDVVKKYVYFVECKSDQGGKLSTLQEREINRLRGLGYKVEVCDFL
jgi:hypothetical protein